MNRYLPVLIGLILFFWPHSLWAQNSPLPDITGWNVINMSRIELRISEDFVVYLGLETEYSNPFYPGDFVRVISRHTPLIILRNKKPDERLFNETASLLYVQEEEQNRLSELSEKADPILYTRWQTLRDPRNNRDFVAGDIDIWIKPANGYWYFIQNKEVEVEFLTENVGNGVPRNVFSGRKYTVEGMYHIVRMDLNDIIELLEKGGR